MNQDVDQRIHCRINRAIHEKVFPGCVLGFTSRPGMRKVIAYGSFTYEENSEKVNENTIYDVASITKSIPTACLALKLIDEGKLSLNQAMIEFIPEFDNSERERVRIKHLLTHTLDSGLRLSHYKHKTPDEILSIILKSDFKTSPGRTFFYSNATSVLLGMVVERVTHQAIDQLAEEWFFGPLNMRRTTFHPSLFDKKQIPPTEEDAWRGRVVQGEVHDESAFRLREKMVVGSAGLFSTVPDLLTFMEMLLSQGSFKGRKYFSPEMARMMHTNQLKEIGHWAGLGWELWQKRFMGQFCSKETFGKTGFTGCVFVCDPLQEKGFVLLTNRTYPKRNPDVSLMNRVRSDIADIVFGGNSQT